MKLISKKKHLFLLLTLVFSLSVVGCSNNNEVDNKNKEEQT